MSKEKRLAAKDLKYNKGEIKRIEGLLSNKNLSPVLRNHYLKYQQSLIRINSQLKAVI